MGIGAGDQILKVRDDAVPLRLKREESPDEPDRAPRLVPEANCPWAPAGEAVGAEKLRSRIEPWLTALVQSEHLSLLIGSGLTQAVHYLATGSALTGMETTTVGAFDQEITFEAKRSAQAAGRAGGNFEDQVRAANDLLRGLRILAATRPDGDPMHGQVDLLRAGLRQVLGAFAQSILDGERRLVVAPSKERERAFNYLVDFLMSFASRSGTRDRLNIFTTNYDRFIESGADLAGLRLIDRFVGTLLPVFRASRVDVDLHYNPPGIRGEPRYLEGVARFTKLHGSVDWVESEGSIRRIGLPFGASSPGGFLSAPGMDGVGALEVMIYPNASKDRETASYPYVELFRDFAAAVCRPNSTLVVYGYGFGDEHINRVIEDMLTIPSTHVVVIARGDPLGRIVSLYDRLGRHAQITLLVGDHLGDLRSLVDYYLPKPAIDRTTVRMAELLKTRWAVSSNKGAEPITATTEDGAAPQ